jgi:hypothetical protein
MSGSVFSEAMVILRLYFDLVFAAVLLFCALQENIIFTYWNAIG